MPSQARIDANRKNAQKSTGPRTHEGKSKVRCNALKDGATARSPIIPGEDPAEFQHRLDTWTEDLAPTNDAERYLVEHAVRASWQLDRLDRAHAARLASQIRNATADRLHNLNQQVASLGRRLFHDPRGPIQTYPHFEYRIDTPRVSWTGLADDPDHPTTLLNELESTEPGCQWLLARWSELLDLLDKGLPWHSPDKLKAIRLLGHQPLDALDQPQIATIFLASHALDPAPRGPFHELWTELLGGEKLVYRIPPRRPQTPAIRTNATSLSPRLAQNASHPVTTRAPIPLANHQDRQQADDEEEIDRLAFDDSPGGERLRRAHATCSRSLLRSLDLLRKSRQPAPVPDPAPEPPSQTPEAPAKPAPADPRISNRNPRSSRPTTPKKQSHAQRKTPSQSPSPRNAGSPSRFHNVPDESQHASYTQNHQPVHQPPLSVSVLSVCALCALCGSIVFALLQARAKQPVLSRQAPKNPARWNPARPFLQTISQTQATPRPHPLIIVVESTNHRLFDNLEASNNSARVSLSSESVPRRGPPSRSIADARALAPAWLAESRYARTTSPERSRPRRTWA